MKIEIEHKPSYAIANIQLEESEQIKAEGGAMVSKSTNVSIETHKAQKGSVFKSLKTAFLGRESFWMNTFTADRGSGELKLAPTLPGDIEHINIDGDFYLQSSSFLAAKTDIDIDTKFQGMKGFFSAKSLFFLKLSGKGSVIISSYGGIEAIDIDSEFIVDTGHVVGFEEGLDYSLSKFGGWKSFFLSGEGIIVKFKGTGRVWVQSRNPISFGRWLRKKLPPKKRQKNEKS